MTKYGKKIRKRFTIKTKKENIYMLYLANIFFSFFNLFN